MTVLAERDQWFRAVSFDHRLDIQDRAAVLTVASLIDERGDAHCGTARLGRILGTSRSRAKAVVNSLVERGLIVEMERDSGGEAVYRLCLSAENEDRNGTTT